jgi:anti-sigma regulatory factor (Ser/Thr protein kinase)
MDPLLIDQWLGDLQPIPVIDEASVAVVRERVRDQARVLGLPERVTASVVNLASELGHNQLAHAREGWVVVHPVLRDGVPGLEVIAADRGDGIAAPAEALLGRPPDPIGGTSLGVGLAAVLELADETDFDVRVGEGTCVWARKFAQGVPRRRQVGVFGRPCPGETISGDHAIFLRLGDGLLVGLADGLGHGPEARIASMAAIVALQRNAAMTPERILEQCHDALRGTRGAVMSVASMVEPGHAVDIASVGNVSAHLYGFGPTRRVSGSSFVVGAIGKPHRAAHESHALGASDALVLFSDGLTTRTDLEGDLDLLREHPVVIAQRMVERFGRNNDDVLVLVAR